MFNIYAYIFVRKNYVLNSCCRVPLKKKKKVFQWSMFFKAQNWCQDWVRNVNYPVIIVRWLFFSGGGTLPVRLWKIFLTPVSGWVLF